MPGTTKGDPSLAGDQRDRVRVSPRGESLEELIGRVALGDRDAFRQLYEQATPKLLGVALRILRDRALAEDAVQEALVKIWHAAAGYRSDRGSGMAWLMTIQRNKAIDMLRARPARHAPLEPAESLADPGPGPAAAAEAADERERIARCLAELPADRAAAVRAAYLEGWSYAELAHRHAVPLNTMRTWLRRSLIRLRECLMR